MKCNLAIIFFFKIRETLWKIHEYEENGEQEKQKYLKLPSSNCLQNFVKIEIKKNKKIC